MHWVAGFFGHGSSISTAGNGAGGGGGFGFNVASTLPHPGRLLLFFFLPLVLTLDVASGFNWAFYAGIGDHRSETGCDMRGKRCFLGFWLRRASFSVLHKMFIGIWGLLLFHQTNSVGNRMRPRSDGKEKAISIMFCFSSSASTLHLPHQRDIDSIRMAPLFY